MKIVLIHGQGHKGITYSMSQCVLKHLKDGETEVQEFFLPKDGPGFCVGCNNCFLYGETHCHQQEKVQPIIKAVEWADVIMLDTPNYCMDMSGAMKSLLDHFAYRWVTHRPHESMFRKVGITLSSSAGAPPIGTVRSLAKQLKWMCVPTVYTFPFISGAMGIGDLSYEKKEKMEKKAQRIANNVKRALKRKHVGIRTKLQFMMFRNMQMGEASSWNPTDKNWWKEQGWLEDKRPWKISVEKQKG